jgi:2-methylisocitrate lyase-like PEP mutase family enzyme
LARLTLADTLKAQVGCLAVPGCWDGLSARLIEQAGFPVSFLSGGAHSMARFGLPDMGFVSLAELSETTRIIVDCASIPLIVDADTGFGNALNTAQTMRVLERAGASAIQLEDQAFPKRCGHMAGKRLVSAQEAAGKIMAAVDARVHGSTLVIGRTDAVSLEGIEEAIDRAQLYLDAGADLIFVEGPTSLEDMAKIQAHFGRKVPLVHNMVSGGTNPITCAAQLDELGVSIALHPLVLLGEFVVSAQDQLGHLMANQASKRPANALTELARLNAIVATNDLIETGTHYEHS